MKIISTHFPQNKEKWKTYLKVFIPIILGSSLFALNGVVDNFMVGNIEQGQSALGAINSWGNILIGWFIATAASGSVLIGQFYFAKKYEIAKQISRYRFWICILPAIALSIVAWTNPDLLTETFAHKPNVNNISESKSYQQIIENGRIYAKIIAIQWILISISFNLGNQLREIGYGFWTMIWGIGTLITNISLNSILMYGLKMGVDGAAWASVAGRIVAITFGLSIIIAKKIKIGFKPWSILLVSLDVRKLFWKRWIYVTSVFTVVFFVTFRSFFYSRGFPIGTLGVGVSGLSVIALTGSLMNIFTTTFAALSSMSARFVGSQLGNGNFNQAKINANELKGFFTTVSAVMSIIMALFATGLPYMSFLAHTKTLDGVVTFSGKSQLKQVSHALYVICFYYPIWIWFSASYRIGNSGGKGGWFSFFDWIITAFQLLWLYIIVTFLNKNWPFAQHNFWIIYIIFFTSDLLKLVAMEFLYYKYTWINKLTKEEQKGKDAYSKDQTELPSNARRS